MNIRDIILEILLSIDKGEEHSHILLKNVLDKYDYLSREDKAFIKRVTEGTLEYRITLDYIINSLSKTPVNKMKPVIRSIMRMSVYQLMYMDKVPDSAVCNEAVKLAGKRGFKGLQGFVNGVLRNIARTKTAVRWPDEKANPREYLSVVYSCPTVIIDSFLSDYGYDMTKSILEATLKERRLYVRIDEYKGIPSLDKITAEWDDAHVTYAKADSLEYAYTISGSESPASFDCFNDGLYTIQDLCSMMVCESVTFRKGDTVLDVCAAPGGKSLHAACKLMCKADGTETTGHVISRDVSDYKVGLIEDNIARMGYENIETQVYDATVLDESMIGKADICLADVPCSGLGVIGKKPDIKYNVTVDSLRDITILQKNIIDNVVRYVKDGGSLVYSTCTLRKAENDDMVDYITSTYGYEAVSVKTYTPDMGGDGFFVAVLKKNG